MIGRKFMYVFNGWKKNIVRMYLIERKFRNRGNFKIQNWLSIDIRTNRTVVSFNFEINPLKDKFNKIATR